MDTATTDIYTLSLHDALPISAVEGLPSSGRQHDVHVLDGRARRSEEHTSELQSRENLVCRLLLEKKKYGSYSVPARSSAALDAIELMEVLNLAFGNAEECDQA